MNRSATAPSPENLSKDKKRCYQYRAQNGFGGMNIEYAVLTPNAANLSTNAGLWNRKCARKNGEDITALATQRMDMVSRFVGQ
jgi:2,4-dienoyl-CoA reductase-like NADH-dependent reductase (Old Yellow Enzyme family)